MKRWMKIKPNFTQRCKQRPIPGYRNFADIVGDCPRIVNVMFKLKNGQDIDDQETRGKIIETVYQKAGPFVPPPSPTDESVAYPWIGHKYCQMCDLCGWQWCHCKPTAAQENIKNQPVKLIAPPRSSIETLA
jgi:hypothetical protein